MRGLRRNRINPFVCEVAPGRASSNTLLPGARIRATDRSDVRVKRGTKLKLAREWVVGDEIGSGGFGRVYGVMSDGDEAVAKLVPKDPGADRELLFVDLNAIRNVVPVIDSGETAREWVLVMPRAERSLREH